MVNNLLENELYKGLYHSVILAIVITILSAAVYIILTKAYKISNQKNKLKIRIAYISCIIMVFFLAKIWVQGFTHIFYGLSLVSAGLVVTNKETIMNLVGWGIISWRSLFSKGDYIEICGHSGVVYELGVFYFKLLESSPTMPSRSTGKFIKIPNGTVINNSIKRLSLDRHFVEQHVQFSVPITKNTSLVRKTILQIIELVLKQYYGQSPYPQRIKKEVNLVDSFVYQKPWVEINFNVDKPEYLRVTATYYCKFKESLEIADLIKDKISELIYVNEGSSLELQSECS